MKSLSLLCVLFFASNAHAQKPGKLVLPQLQLPSCPHEEGITAGVMLGGENGVWFPKDNAKCVMARLRGLQVLVLADRDNEIRAARAEGLRDVDVARYESAKDEASVSGSRAETAIKDKNDAEESEASLRESMGAWYRSPFFWFGTGVVVTVIVEVAVFVLAVGL